MSPDRRLSVANDVAELDRAVHVLRRYGFSASATLLRRLANRIAAGEVRMLNEP